MLKGTSLTQSQLKEIRSISCRHAHEKFGIGFRTWQKVKRDPSFIPSRCRDPRREAALVEKVLQSVKEAPHLNTQVRAKNLGERTQRVQRILAERGLSKLNARLEHAGYQVETLRPLQVARQRRIVASYPGSLTHIDYKTFGFLRGRTRKTGGRIGGYVVIDSLTAFATMHLASVPNAASACSALEKHRTKAPFELDGIVFSDNGPQDFTTKAFIEFVMQNGWMQRTTRYNHPWSNGKVEALNKTLKYQCFPTLEYADVDSLEGLEKLTDVWMDFYNRMRAHNGHVNKGLPPLVFYDLWLKAPGTELEKLVHLGVIDLDSEWTLRRMGDDLGNGGDRPRGDGQKANGAAVPFAFVLESPHAKRLMTDNSDRSHLMMKPPSAQSSKRFLPAK